MGQEVQLAWVIMLIIAIYIIIMLLVISSKLILIKTKQQSDYDNVIFKLNTIIQTVEEARLPTPEELQEIEDDKKETAKLIREAQEIGKGLD